MFYGMFYFRSFTPKLMKIELVLAEKSQQADKRTERTKQTNEETRRRRR